MRNKGQELKNKKFPVSAIIAICVAVGAFGLDILTKYIVEANLAVGQSASFIPGFIGFLFDYNDGAGFSILSGKRALLIIFSIVILVVIITFFVLKLVKSPIKVSKTLGWAIGLIGGGCLGNLYDRIVIGQVRDFINLEFMRFPIFNLADTALTIGMIVLFVYLIFIYPKEEKKAKEIKENKEDK